MLKLPSNDVNDKRRAAYDLEILTMDENVFPGISGDFRNMRITQETTQQLVACGPPLPLPIDVFESLHSENLVVRELYEGTWIMLFFHPSYNRWELATRGTIGGNAWYTRLDYAALPLNRAQKTYREMFLEILGVKDLTPEHFPLLAQLPPTNCYSFVLQHRDNPIVLPIYQNRLILDFAGRIDPFDGRVAVADTSVWTKVAGVHFPVLLTHIQSVRHVFANQLSPHNAALIAAEQPLPPKELIFEMSRKDRPFDTRCGIVVVNAENGDRAIIRNALYEEIKRFRGNHPNLQYQYFELLRQKQIKAYLTLFPMFRPLFDAFYREFNATCETLYDVYKQCFMLPGSRKKKTGITEVLPRVPKKHFVKASAIHHNLYIPAIIKGTRTLITMEKVREFLLTLSTQQLLYYLNQKEDDIEAEAEVQEQQSS
jgi:hypothetical protein